MTLFEYFLLHLNKKLLIFFVETNLLLNAIFCYKNTSVLQIIHDTSSYT